MKEAQREAVAARIKPMTPVVPHPRPPVVRAIVREAPLRAVRRIPLQEQYAERTAAAADKLVQPSRSR